MVIPGSFLSIKPSNICIKGELSITICLIDFDSANTLRGNKLAITHVDYNGNSPLSMYSICHVINKIVHASIQYILYVALLHVSPWSLYHSTPYYLHPCRRDLLVWDKYFRISFENFFMGEFLHSFISFRCGNAWWSTSAHIWYLQLVSITTLLPHVLWSPRG